MSLLRVCRKQEGTGDFLTLAKDSGPHIPIRKYGSTAWNATSFLIDVLKLTFSIDSY